MTSPSTMACPPPSSPLRVRTTCLQNCNCHIKPLHPDPIIHSLMPHTQLVLYDADVSSSLERRSRNKKRKNIFSAGVVIILAAVSGHIFNYDENLMLHCMVWSRNRSMTSSSCHLLKGGGTMPQSYRAIHGAYCNRYARACALFDILRPISPCCGVASK
jgi:hypothetical protein